MVILFMSDPKESFESKKLRRLNIDDINDILTLQYADDSNPF